jgi:hypothetical protein
MTDDTSNWRNPVWTDEAIAAVKRYQSGMKYPVPETSLLLPRCSEQARKQFDSNQHAQHSPKGVTP